ncbi:MAG: 50S ribosomal protein L10, partial [Armatimonadota bacterium]
TDCAKALLDYAKTNKKFTVKGGLIGGRAFTAKDVEAFAALPSKEVLIAQVIGAIAAPLSNLVGVIEALYADPIRVIGAVADKVAEGSPIPAPKAEVAAPAAEATDTTSSEAAEAAPAETPAEAPATAETETPTE